LRNRAKETKESKYMHWYLIYTHSCHEKKVKKRLDRERLETFLPVAERWSLRKERRERISLPLFPGYLFVRTEMNATIYLKILRIQGVIGFFCNSGKPAAIPDEEMENIQRDFRKSHKSLSRERRAVFSELSENGKDGCPVETFGTYSSKKFIYSHSIEEAALR